MNLGITVYVAVIVVNAILAIVVYKNNSKSATNIIFSLLSLITILWLIVVQLSLLPQFLESSLLWIRLSIFLAVPQALLLFLLAHTLPFSAIQLRKKILYPVLLFSLLIMIMNLSPFAFKRIEIINGSPNPVPGPVLPVFALTIIALFFGAIYSLFNKIRRNTGAVREQAKAMMFGILLMLGFIIATIMIPLIVFRISTFVTFSPVYTLLFLGMTAYAIVKHKFLDIRALVARTVSYTIIIFVVVAVFVSLLYTLTLLIPELGVTTKQVVVFSLLSLILFFTGAPIQRLVESLTDKIFFKGRYDSEELLSELTHIMARDINIQTLSENLLETLNKQMRLTRSAFIVINKEAKQAQVEKGADNSRFSLTNSELENLLFGGNILVFDEMPEGDLKMLMRKHAISIFTPLKSGEKLAGYLLLGAKSSGDIYNNQDIDVIDIFRGQVAVALQNALAYLEIQEFSRTLEKKVIERTQELKESQERELAKANELLKLKDEFVFIATHDLRTPVTAIDGYISLIEEEKPNLPKDVESNFEEVKSASGRLKQLINDLLEVARSESGTIKIEVAPLDINTLTEKVVKEVKTSAEEKKVKLETNLDQSAKMVMADEDKLYEVVENLVSNAVKFNKPDGSVTISTKKDGNMLEVKVSDTGHGIPKGEQDKVFQKFFKYRGDETMEVPGTGLGLFVVRMLIEKMGGKISFTSEEEKGTTFTFTLPLADQNSVLE